MTMSMKFVSLALLTLLSLAITSCTQKATQADGPQRWVSYQDKIDKEDRELRKAAGLRATVALSADPADSTKTIPVAIDSFDREGYLVSNRTFDPTGAVIKEVNHIVRDGRLIETRQTEPERSVTVQYTYDAQGWKTHELVLDDKQDTLLTRQFKYDSIGNEIEARFYRKATQTHLSKTTQYDSLGRPRIVQEWNGDLLNWEERYNYTDTLWITERFAKGQLQSRFKMRYDDQGHCTFLEHLSGEGKSRMSVHMAYNPQGSMTSEKTDGIPGTWMQTFQYTYDPKGLRITKTLLRPDIPQGLTVHYENRFYK